jgi:hypothetical protein
MKTAFPIILSLILVINGYAGSATWNLDPVSRNWNDPLNWTPNTVPNGPADVATFGQSNITDVHISGRAEVNTIIFSPGASAFTITVAKKQHLTISGTGISNNSGIMQNFITAGAFGGGFTSIQFTGNATAGDLAMFTNQGNSFGTGHCETDFGDDATAGTATFVNESFLSSSVVEAGRTQFFDRSSAEKGTFINNAPDNGYDAGATIFMDHSTAADGTFIVNGGNGFPATVSFFENSNAGNGNFTLNAPTQGQTAGGQLYIWDTASAANGIFMVHGGTLSFLSASTAANATLIGDGRKNPFQRSFEWRHRPG